MQGELTPAIVQDSATGRVLMLAWMDEEAERRTRETGDGDALLVRVKPAGPTCHTGSVSCFAPELWRTIAARAAERPAGSYTAELLEQGVGACARKVGEEAVEVAVAALDETDERVVEEAADLVYHLYVLLAARGLDLAAVDDVLRARA
jgi:phosphoribosyl-ATP pyrophosphohydrolase/phosphoribosyl-AMP cyclohydrolase